MIGAVAAAQVNTEAIHAGDIVHVAQAGRLFHATVRGRGVGGFVIEPHDRATRARRAAPGEIVGHWVHTSRTQVAPDGQLTLEDLDG